MSKKEFYHLVEEELKEKKNEIKDLTQRIRILEEELTIDYNKYEQKITLLEKALKGKNKQLIDYIKRNR